MAMVCFKVSDHYDALKTSDLTNVETLVKPDAEKYFVERSESTENLPRLPALSESLNTAFDEKSLFPKYMLDFEMKMKNHHNTVMNQFLHEYLRGALGVSNGTQFLVSFERQNLSP
ncbi:hypothetical protein LOTGIDRAFT_164722 [Lottia gigantea]|uniref:Uncharacterized protein n=1 Tax=Lottia gigantea TaxID=225164 RepID=V3ZZ61_LOTGI|nr:hypothetical protein LOTGIDRAFT_164722 [Lottia gigantea]ESO89702.1 hypothetical protein LOTGIDRAFT_164722 [Lottia gigantea]